MGRAVGLIWRRLCKLAACTILLAACDRPQPVGGHTMGTTWSLKIAGSISASQAAELQKQIQERLDRLEAVFSNWRPDSEVSRFNRARTTEPVTVSPELARIAKAALEVARETEGAFDPTISPLIDLWGFGSQGRKREPPADAEVERCRERCGWQQLEAALDPPSLRKRIPDLELNLSAIVEGHALAQIGDIIARSKFENWLLEIGGEMLARGGPASGQPWRAGIQAPEAASREIFNTVELRDEALGSSGSYQQFFEHDGRRCSHLIDPRTGRPVDHGLASVSVIHRDPLTADAYATALMVMGLEWGELLAKRLGLRVIWIRPVDRPASHSSASYRSRSFQNGHFGHGSPAG